MRGTKFQNSVQRNTEEGTLKNKRKHLTVQLKVGIYYLLNGTNFERKRWFTLVPISKYLETLHLCRTEMVAENI